MKNRKIVQFVPLGVLGAWTLASGMALAGGNTYADVTDSGKTATVSTSVKVLEACSMTTDASASTAHYAEIVGGTAKGWADDPDGGIGLTAIDVTCNDRNGYAIYVQGVDGTANEAADTDLTGQATGQKIPTGLDKTGNVSNWAMRLSAVNDNTTYFVPTVLADANGSFASDHVVPSTLTKAVAFTSDINTSKPSRFTATYAAAVTPYQSADTYVGHVKYTVVHPNFSDSEGQVAVAVSIVNGTSVTIDGRDYTSGQTAYLDGGKHTIAAVYDTTNYHFVNWTGTDVDFTDASAEETEFTATGSSAAVVLNAAMNCNSTIAGNMQEFNPCSTIANGASGTMKDARDGKTYTVAKLADGNFWMTSNLNLAGGTVLSNDLSDVPSANYYTLPNSTAISSGTSVPSDQFSSDSGQYVFNTNNNTTTCNSSTPCNSYYSWLVATAGGKDASGADVTGNGYDTAYSICPKGWKLPTSGKYDDNGTTIGYKKGDFYKMILAVTGQSSLASGYYENTANFYNNAGPGTVPGFLLAGYYNGGSFSNGGSYGYYWSATSYSSTYAYYLNFNSGSVNSANNGNRRYGFSVRCMFGD